MCGTVRHRNLDVARLSGLRLLSNFNSQTCRLRSSRPHLRARVHDTVPTQIVDAVELRRMNTFVCVRGRGRSLLVRRLLGMDTIANARKLPKKTLKQALANVGLIQARGSIPFNVKNGMSETAIDSPKRESPRSVNCFIYFRIRLQI
jgi:hypothetical protein